MGVSKTVAKLSSDNMIFLKLCAGLELKVAALYHYFEGLFAEDLKFSLLWQKTALEEENHSYQFDLGGRLKGIGMEGLNIDVSEATDYLHKIELFLDNNITSTPSQKEALILAIKLEEQLAALHMSSMVIFEDQEMKKMFEAMMQNDQGHISMLQDFLDTLNSSQVKAI